MRNGISILEALCLLACLGAGGCAASAPSIESDVAAATPPIDRPLPDVAVAALDGSAVHLADELGHRPALVSLWATWCDACVEEFEPLRRLHAQAGAEGAVVVALSVGEAAETVAAFVKRRELAWPQFVDPEFRFADALGEKRVPTTLVVDHRARIVFVGGRLDEDALSALRKAIAVRANEPG